MAATHSAHACTFNLNAIKAINHVRKSIESGRETNEPTNQQTNKQQKSGATKSACINNYDTQNNHRPANHLREQLLEVAVPALAYYFAEANSSNLVYARYCRLLLATRRLRQFFSIVSFIQPAACPLAKSWSACILTTTKTEDLLAYLQHNWRRREGEKPDLNCHIIIVYN